MRYYYIKGNESKRSLLGLAEEVFLADVVEKKASAEEARGKGKSEK